MIDELCEAGVLTPAEAVAKRIDVLHGPNSRFR
jgi:hypothetical protein